MIPPCRAPPDPGFSLLEMLVVVAILAAALTLVLPQIQRPGSRASLETATVELAAGLRALHARAIASNEEQVFAFDAATKTYVLGTNPRAVSLSPALAVTLETARSAIRAPTEARLVFYPGGGSSGGSITLVGDGRRTVVRVDWLSGAVTITRDPT